MLLGSQLLACDFWVIRYNLFARFIECFSDRLSHRQASGETLHAAQEAELQKAEKLGQLLSHHFNFISQMPIPISSKSLISVGPQVEGWVLVQYIYSSAQAGAWEETEPSRRGERSSHVRTQHLILTVSASGLTGCVTPPVSIRQSRTSASILVGKVHTV